MEIRLLNKDKEHYKLSFLLKDVSPAFANMFRRIMREEVPTMAIEDIEFAKNSSVLYDEMVGHRLGLLPIKTDLKSYNLISECKCEGKGCARCTLKMTLEAKGPGSVYAEEIKSKDPKVVPVFGKTPIVKLIKGQEIEFEATAILGKGKEHMKWSPGLVHYKYKPVVEITSDCNNCQECLKCPKKVFESKSNKVSVNKDTLFDCHLCGYCLEICPKNAIKLNEKETEFIFYVESWGQLPPTTIVSQALEIFQSKLEEFSAAVKKA